MGGKTAAKENYKIKAQFGGNTFVAQVFSDPSSDKNVVADFRKKTGSAVEFRNLYQEIRAQLADIVLQPSVTSKDIGSIETTTETTTDIEVSS